MSKMSHFSAFKLHLRSLKYVILPCVGVFDVVSEHCEAILLASERSVSDSSNACSLIVYVLFRTRKHQYEEVHVLSKTRTK